MTTRKLRPRGVAREDIVIAATRLFADRGYADVTLREIAHKAKVHLPAIYKVFKNKRALYVHCCVQTFEISTIEIAKYVNEATSDRGKVFAFANTMSRLHISRPIVPKLAYRCVLDGDLNLVHTIMESAGDAYHGQVIKALERMVGPNKAYRVFFALSSLIFGANQLRDFRIGGSGEPSPKNVDELTIFSLESLMPDAGWDELLAGTPAPAKAVTRRKRA